MQIQRIQSLYLLIAFGCALTSIFLPWLHFERFSMDVYAWSNIFMLILASLATVLPLLAIVMFRNLRRQKLVAAIAAFMAIFALGYVVALSYFGPDPDGSLCPVALICMAASALFDILGRNAIISDEKLLKSADRIR